MTDSEDHTMKCPVFVGDHIKFLDYTTIKYTFQHTICHILTSLSKSYLPIDILLKHLLMTF